jgi:hypothetical protein
MYKKKSGIDIIAKILDAVYQHNTDALFTMSLMHQYEERGSLSKKQLEGLLAKARKVDDLPPSWLGTLEAIILKMPTRYKSTVEEITPVYNKDGELGKMIAEILAKFAGHKRVLFLKTRYDTNALTPVEMGEVKKIYKILLEKGTGNGNKRQEA